MLIERIKCFLFERKERRISWYYSRQIWNDVGQLTETSISSVSSFLFFFLFFLQRPAWQPTGGQLCWLEASVMEIMMQRIFVRSQTVFLLDISLIAEKVILNKIYGYYDKLYYKFDVEETKNINCLCILFLLEHGGIMTDEFHPEVHIAIKNRMVEITSMKDQIFQNFTGTIAQTISDFAMLPIIGPRWRHHFGTKIIQKNFVFF